MKIIAQVQNGERLLVVSSRVEDPNVPAAIWDSITGWTTGNGTLTAGKAYKFGIWEEPTGSETLPDVPKEIIDYLKSKFERMAV